MTLVITALGKVDLRENVFPYVDDWDRLNQPSHSHIELRTTDNSNFTTYPSLWVGEVRDNKNN